MLVNADELITALESSDREVEWYLDLTNGAVVPVFSDLVGEEENEAIADAVETQPDRFFPIEPIGSQEAFRIMEAFVATLPAGTPADRLSLALGQRHPFRGFKDALLAWPPIREQWFRIHNARMREHAQDWLTGNQLEFTLTDQPASSLEA